MALFSPGDSLLPLIVMLLALAVADTGGADTGGSDTGVADTGASDTGSGDTGSGDTGSGDTGSSDTGSSDTGSSDTGSGDTGSGDTGSGDTGEGETDTPEEPDICEEGQRIATDDYDGDGLSDQDELTCGSDPCVPDTDQDGVWDGVEAEGSGPCGPDSDGDGTADLLDPDSPGATGTTEDNVQPEGGMHGIAGGQYTGGACSTGAASPAFLPTMLLIGMLLGRRWWPATLGLLGALPAQAQELNVQRLQPAMDAKHFVGLEESQVGEPGIGGGLVSHYARDPLMVRSPAGDTALVSHLWTTDLGVHLNHGRISAGVGLPIHGVVKGHTAPESRWLGDASICGKLEILDGAAGPVGLATTARLGLPTGNGHGWLGSPGVHGSGGVALTTGEVVVLGLNLGAEIGPSTDLGELIWGPALSWRAGASTSVREDLWVSGEIDGAHHLSSPSAPGAHPLEALLSLGHQPISQMVLTVGGGAGLSKGVGAPRYRGLLGIRWLTE